MKNKIVMNLQLFGATKSGVYPCYENQFQIDTAASGGTASLKNIADCVTFSVSFDNGVEEWNPFDGEGWVSRLMTSKSVTISVTAKRNVGMPEMILLQDWHGRTEEMRKLIRSGLSRMVLL